jgi:HD superfamily phosphodiesterase
MTIEIDGVKIPDSALVRKVTELARENTTPLLFNHSSRVFYFGALAGARQKLKFDPELLYCGCMFHDFGLMKQYSSANERFEVDGANAARDFLKQEGISQSDIDTVWTSIALHTTPGIPQHMHPVIALVTAGVEMDVLGLKYDQYSDTDRDSVVKAHPRGDSFKEEIISAFYEGIKHKPETTFGNVKADVIADKEPHFHAGNFCCVIRKSMWPS